MMLLWTSSKCLLVFLFLVVRISWATDLQEVRSINPGIVRMAYFPREGSHFGPVLNAIYYGKVHIDPSSSPCNEFVSKLYDGVFGSFDNFPGEFVLFGGPKAVIRVDVPSWRNVAKLSFRAVELTAQKPARVKIYFKKADGTQQPLKTERAVFQSKLKAEIAEYSTLPFRADLSRGEIVVQYENDALGAVLIDEIALDDLGKRKEPLIQEVYSLDRWLLHYSVPEYARIDKEYHVGLKDGEILKILMGKPSDPIPSRLVFWEEAKSPDHRFSIFSFFIQVDHTGDMVLDLVRGMIVLPKNFGPSVPLMVLNHQGTAYGMDEPLGFAGREENAFAPELARNGIAVLVLDSFLRNGIFSAGDRVYRYHPHWSATGKEVDHLKRTLDFVLSSKFNNLTGISIDQKRIGNSGFSYGALNSLISGLADPRYKLVTLSHLENYSIDWLTFSDALYIPQLTYFNRENFPIHVCRLLQNLKANSVLASAGDPGLTNHYRECLTKKDRHIEVILNPVGKTMTTQERTLFLDYIYKSFGMSVRARNLGPKYNINGDPLPFSTQDNFWRQKIIEAMTP